MFEMCVLFNSVDNNVMLANTSDNLKITVLVIVASENTKLSLLFFAKGLTEFVEHSQNDDVAYHW